MTREREGKVDWGGRRGKVDWGGGRGKLDWGGGRGKVDWGGGWTWEEGDRNQGGLKNR